MLKYALPNAFSMRTEQEQISSCHLHSKRSKAKCKSIKFNNSLRSWAERWLRHHVFESSAFYKRFPCLCLYPCLSLYTSVCVACQLRIQFFSDQLFLQSIKAYLLDPKYFHTLFFCLPYSFLVTKRMISHCADTYELHKLIALLTQWDLSC